MDLHSRLLGFIVDLPGMPLGLEERKDFVHSTGFWHLAPSIQWDGAPRPFLDGFLSLLAAQGGDDMARFLEVLPFALSTPLGAADAEYLQALRAEMASLSEADVRRQFALVEGSAAAPRFDPRRPSHWVTVAAALALMVGLPVGYLTARNAMCTPARSAQLPAALRSLCAATTASAPGSVAPAPTPTPWLTGDFKIAVAEFSELDAQGEVQRSDKGRGLAQQMYEELHRQLAGSANTVQFAFLDPSQTGIIAGATEPEREDGAVRRAREVNADLLIYGDVAIGTDGTTLRAVLYLSPQQIEFAEEMAGFYPLGNLAVDGNIEKNLVASSTLRERLQARISGLSNFVLGLAYFNLRRFAEAVPALEESLVALAQTDSDGQEVVYLFLGSTAAQLGDLPLAHQYYAHAQEIDDRFARAALGEAQIRLLLAMDDCAPGGIDVPAMRAAVAAIEDTLALRADALAAVPNKVDLLVGSAYLCLSAADEDDLWDEAEAKLKRVVEAYVRESDPRLRYLAAQAQSRLGVLYLARSQVDSAFWVGQAEDAFEQANAWSRVPQEKARNALGLAYIHASLGDCGTAQADLAVAQAEYDRIRSDGSPAYVKFDTDYQERVKQLQGSSCGGAPAKSGG